MLTFFERGSNNLHFGKQSNSDLKDIKARVIAEKKEVIAKRKVTRLINNSWETILKAANRRLQKNENARALETAFQVADERHAFTPDAFTTIQGLNQISDEFRRLI